MNKHEYLKLVERSFLENYIGEYVYSKKRLEDIINFHQSCSRIPTHEINNLNESWQKERYLRSISFSDRSINFNDNKIHFDSFKTEQPSLNKDFDRNFEMPIDILGQVLMKSFGNNEGDKTKKHDCIDNFQSVLPLLLVLKNNSVSELSPGSYLFNRKDHSITKIQNWRENNFKDIITAFVGDDELPSYTAIAYAIDIRNSLISDGKRGYRHSLIEIGLLLQRFRESLIQYDKDLTLSDSCWSKFTDNKVTYLCGLNVRSAPITLIQWFGKLNKGWQ